jgi:succinyl-diaminopimelate desuccinylase
VIDAVDLAARLVRCPSVTPAEGGALSLLEDVLRPMGFECRRLVFEAEGTDPVDNLFARLGTGAPHICFAGHTDVVPVGDAGAWSHDPFSGDISDGQLWGRGAADMKGAIASFVAAVASYLSEAEAPKGSISLLITGDEEGPSVNGTTRVLDWMEANGHVPDFCIVGEPTNQAALGDMAKIGRRGSFTGTLTVKGIQGHTAYPHLADNPIHRLVRMLQPFTSGVLDEGTDHFPPTTLMLTTVDVGNPATNVIPASVKAVFNIRFNDLHSSTSLAEMLRASFDREAGATYEFAWSCSGESFLTEPGTLSALVSEAINDVTGRRPELSTTGGTSDARFIKRLCPVVEFGLIGQTMHKVDERVTVDSITDLHQIYHHVLRRVFT